MVRELGFLQDKLAGTDYSPSAVHALLETGARGATTAAQLAKVLGLEKSSVSRLIGKLIQAGELREYTNADDRRTKLLMLTDRGQRTVDEINCYGQMQVTSALANLDLSQHQTIAQGLRVYAQALKAYRLGESPALSSPIQIREGYCPGLVGRITDMHAAYYSRHYNFGQFFESQVATGVAEFAGRLSEQCNKVWIATDNDRIVGSVAIDGQDLGNNEAHLRWFIIDDGCRGAGLGRRLLQEAVDFCDAQNFETIQLWTFKGLDAARKLYESVGFQLAREEQGSQWGTAVTEQQFTRR